MIVEAVCCSAEDCTAAASAGASRIELCTAIELGGLTPSLALLEQAKALCRIPIMAMLRPRAGGFVYTKSEVQTMSRDLDLLEAADGFVFGVLSDRHEIDVDACKVLCPQCGDREKVFHRAFDLLADPFDSLEKLIDLGFDRILTSGQARTAEEGITRLERLHEAAKSRIEILPGGGIRSTNAQIFRGGPWSGIHLAPRRRNLDAFGLEHEVLDASEIAKVSELLAEAR